MVTIFNRKELFITYSMERQSEIRRRLSEHGVDYSIKYVSRSGKWDGIRTRAPFGTFGQDMDYDTEYIFYVRRKDYERACSMIGVSLD